MADITATIIETSIAGEVVDGATITATTSGVPVTTTVTDGDTVTATVTEVPVATELVNGDTLTATITEVPITSTIGPLTEVDPIFLAHDAFGITAGDITLLTDLTALALTDGNFIVADGANWVAEAGDTARTSLGVGSGDSPTFAGSTINGDIIVTGTVDGVDISASIDQDVSSGSSPTLDGANFTGVPNGALDENYVNHTLADAVNDFLVASGPDTFVIKTLAEAGAILEADIDHGNLQGLGDGSDHTFIDQSVISGATPTFTGTNFTGIPDGALSTDYVEVAGDQMDGDLVIDNTSTEAFLVRQDADAGDVFLVDTTNSEIEVNANIIMGEDNWIGEGSGAGQPRVLFDNNNNSLKLYGQSIVAGAPIAHSNNDTFEIYYPAPKLRITDKRNIAYYSEFLSTVADNAFTISVGGTPIINTYGFFDADELGIGVKDHEDVLYIDTSGQVIIDNTATEALLVRKDADAGDVFTVNTTSNIVTATADVYPGTDDTYYLGKNDDDSPFAWKGVIVKDTTNGTYYRIETINGVVTATDLTD